MKIDEYLRMLRATNVYLMYNIGKRAINEDR